MNRSNIKSYNSGNNLKERRKLAGEIRNFRREELLKVIRNISDDTETVLEEIQEEPNKRVDHQNKIKKIQEEYALCLSNPDWLVEVPDDLCGVEDSILGWYVIPRCEGKRCLVISSKGKTISRTKNGQIFQKFQSLLPGGNKEQRNTNGYSIVECIYYEPLKTYYAVDVIQWKETFLSEMDVKFRFFWVNSKIQFDPDFQTISSTNTFVFKCLPYFECTVEGIMNAYTNDFGYIKDGLIFYNKSSYYEVGCTPLILQWKDKVTSRYTIDTDNSGVPLADLIIVLKVSENGDLLTFDEHLIGNLPNELRVQNNILPNSLVRLKVTGMEFNEEYNIFDSKITGLDFYRNCGFSKTLPDTWSRILFQYLCRANPLTIEKILSQSIPLIE